MPRGSTHSAETRAKMSAAGKGRVLSEEHKARISVANKGKSRSKVHERRCHCGTVFLSGAHNAVSCSKECARAVLVPRKARTPEESRVLSLRRFGITVEDYDAMFEAQGGVCAGCKKPETSLDHHSGRSRRLAVDHCHESGRVRGLLCQRCNIAIGQVRDSADLLEQLAAYLRR